MHNVSFAIDVCGMNGSYAKTYKIGDRENLSNHFGVFLKLLISSSNIVALSETILPTAINGIATVTHRQDRASSASFLKFNLRAIVVNLVRGNELTLWFEHSELLPCSWIKI